MKRIQVNHPHQMNEKIIFKRKSLTLFINMPSIVAFLFYIRNLKSQFPSEGRLTDSQHQPCYNLEDTEVWRCYGCYLRRMIMLQETSGHVCDVCDPPCRLIICLCVSLPLDNKMVANVFFCLGSKKAWEAFMYGCRLMCARPYNHSIHGVNFVTYWTCIPHVWGVHVCFFCFT